jgi:hypothetical protein
MQYAITVGKRYLTIEVNPEVNADLTAEANANATADGEKAAAQAAPAVNAQAGAIGDRGHNAARLAEAVSTALRERPARPALISAKGSRPLRLIDLYWVARSLGHTPLREQRIAFMYEAEDCLESSRFIESIAEEHGLRLAVFGTAAEAAGWLCRDTPMGQRSCPGHTLPRYS